MGWPFGAPAGKGSDYENCRQSRFAQGGTASAAPADQEPHDPAQATSCCILLSEQEAIGTNQRQQRGDYGGQP